MICIHFTASTLPFIHTIFKKTHPINPHPRFQHTHLDCNHGNNAMPIHLTVSLKKSCGQLLVFLIFMPLPKNDQSLFSCLLGSSCLWKVIWAHNWNELWTFQFLLQFHRKVWSGFTLDLCALQNKTNVITMSYTKASLVYTNFAYNVVCTVFSRNGVIS